MKKAPCLRIISLLAMFLVFLTSASCGTGGDNIVDTTISTGSATETTLPPDTDDKYILKVKIPADSVEKTIENIPLLLRIGDADFLSHCSEHLENLHVYSADGSELSYEIDNLTAIAADIWISLPAVSAGSDTVLTLTTATDAAPDAGFTGVNPSSVWSDWELVLHMNGSISDSSPKSYAVSGKSSPSAGVIGSAAEFNGTSDALTIDKSFTPPGSVSLTANAYTDTGYLKPAPWEYAQGLTTDGTYFYFAGHHDKTNEGSSIHKIRMSDMTEVAIYEKTGPMHGAELAYASDRGTIFACTGGNGRAAAVWELDKDTGVCIRKWDFATVSYGGAALVAYYGNSEIILFTSIEDGAKYALDRIKLNDNGTYTILGTWTHSSGEDLGVPQGLEYRDGYVYLLDDAGASVSVDPHYIYKLKIDPASAEPQIVEKYAISINYETEGLCFTSDGSVYFGTAQEKIYSMSSKYNKLTPYTDPSADVDYSFSVMALVYVDTAPGKYPNILGFGAASGNQNAFALHLMGDTPGILRYGTTMNGTWTRFDSAAGALPYGAWHLIAATYDGNVMKLYIDGKSAGQLDAAGKLTDRGGAFVIGADIENNALANFFNGKIDEVRYTRRVLTAGEISLINANINGNIFVAAD